MKLFLREHLSLLFCSIFQWVNPIYDTSQLLFTVDGSVGFT